MALLVIPGYFCWCGIVLSVDALSTDLRSLSAAVVAAVEKAEDVTQETDRWLNDHQNFQNLDLVQGLLGEVEVRLCWNIVHLLPCCLDILYSEMAEIMWEK